MSNEQLFGRFSPEPTQAAEEILVRDELHAVTAIFPSGILLPAMGSEPADIITAMDSRWRWRVATWPDRGALHMSAPLSVTDTELPTVMQAQPEWAAWMLEQTTEQLKNIHRYYSRLADDQDPIGRAFPEGLLSVLHEAQAAVEISYDLADLRDRIPLVTRAMAKGAVTYAAPLIEGLASDL